MKLFNRKTDLIKKEHAKKHGIYSTFFIVAMILAVVFVNIFASVLYEKYPIEIDLTKQKVYSLSDENIEYIKTITDDVTVYVWAKRSDFTDGTLEQYFLSNFYYLDKTGKYFSQYMKNIDLYEKYNSHIKIEYVDTNSPEASDVKSLFSNDYIYGGDLLITSTVTVDGKEITRTKHLNSYDLFSAEYDSTTNYYNILASNLENDLSAAINYVTSKKISKVAFLSGIGDVSVLSAFKENLTMNSYEAEEITSFKSITPENFDVVVLAAPTKDLTENELDILDEFLDNNGNKGKVLLTFGNPSAANAPNFSEFLSEWGLLFGSGTVMETNENYHYPDNPYTFFYKPENTEYCSAIPSDMYLVSADNSPINILFDQDGARTTKVLAYSNDSAVIRPKNASKNWKPKKGTEEQIPLAAVCEEKSADETATSTIIAFSSTDLANEEWTQFTAIANTDFMFDTTKYATDKNNESVTFSVNTILTDSIFDQISQKSATVMKVIFIYLLPIVTVIIGIVVFVKRKNR